MTTAYRWERERAAGLLARSRAGTSSRRRSEQLSRRARRGGRAGTGVEGSALHDDLTPPLWRRLNSTDEGGESMARAILLAVVAVDAALVIGPAVLAAVGLYRVMWWISPRIGRLWVSPWAALGAALIVVGLLLGWLPAPSEVAVGLSPYWPVVRVQVASGDWLLWQAVLAPLGVAFLIWAWGWAAVPKNAVAKAVKNKDGTFRVTPDKEKVRLDPLAGEEISESKVLLADAGSDDDWVEHEGDLR
ncbi:hypothetical protein ABH922_001796 [Rhodococcus sp. 27YEA15]|uniref:hypothetical protein n=1 Tax=Rhodococcus sp. 27YEA15 TaxID=3156259 RepID=UPI003C7D9F74